MHALAPADTEPTAASLIARAHAARDADHALAAHYAPILQLDSREPFRPSLVGYTVFRADAESPSFPRRIRLQRADRAAVVIEYALWWDWDIQHLYELEHLWVYLDAAGRVIFAEGSWHGGYQDMLVDDAPPLEGNRLLACAEPGKHAMLPMPGMIALYAPLIAQACSADAGGMGLHVTPLFEGRIRGKCAGVDALVTDHLKRLAFEPRFDFARRCAITPEMLIPWPALQAWIPRRVHWWIGQLMHGASQRSEPAYHAAPQWGEAALGVAR